MVLVANEEAAVEGEVEGDVAHKSAH